MKLHLFRHLWGVNETWETVFPLIKANGYTGIEAPLPSDEDKARFKALLKEYHFEYIPLIFTSGKTVTEHIESFRAGIETASQYRLRQITSHSGVDGWSDRKSKDFFEHVLKIEAEYGIPVAHETHRGRILYNPWVTRRMLRRFDDLKLCCDFSHWVCVTERLLDGELSIIQLAANHCYHIHARVGYAEGPQVSDPRSPEFRVELQAHEKWWQMVWDAQEQQGFRVSTLTPEYGPPPYLHTLPGTDVPVGDVWEICEWQAKREAELFAQRG